MDTNIKEKENRRRGLVAALLLHSIIVVLCIYPFLVGPSSIVETYDSVVMLDFTRSAAQTQGLETSRNNELTPKTMKKAAGQKAKPAEKTEESPPPPVLTAPSNLPPIKDLPSNEETAAKPIIPKIEKTKVVDIPAKPSQNDENSSGNNNGSDPVTGSATPGKGTTVTDMGSGEASMGSALEGEGVIGRAVTFRPNLDEIITQNGTVVVNVCINRRGRVIGVKWNKERSTITDKDVVRKAVSKAKHYKFEVDYDAPTRECGSLGIHIKGL